VIGSVVFIVEKITDTLYALSSGIADTITSISFARGSKLLIEVSIYSRNRDSVTDDIFSNSNALMLLPKEGLKNLSPLFV
jgi:hypothetical protein